MFFSSVLIHNRYLNHWLGITNVDCNLKVATRNTD